VRVATAEVTDLMGVLSSLETLSTWARDALGKDTHESTRLTSVRRRVLVATSASDADGDERSRFTGDPERP